MSSRYLASGDRMAESLDECPECKSDDLEVVSTHDIRPPHRSKGKIANEAKPVARTIWVRCRSCGWDGSILRKLGDERPAR
jgi:hypothetical protein